MKKEPVARIDISDMFPMPIREHVIRTFLIITASVIMSLNIKSFVEAGGLFPGGFTGLSLLIQRSADEFLGLTIPFSLINFLLNVIPAAISFRFIGKRFTIYSCLSIVITSILTDIIPSISITNDILLICIFGGIINGFSIAICLFCRATSGGTDFIAVALSEKLHIDAWNYIFLGNAVMLVIAGILFGWDKALYSIIFQFASTQIVKSMNLRYKRATLFIISEKSEQIYEKIREITHHTATLFHGTGLYDDKQRSMIYSVISGDQVKKITKQVKEIDPSAFINIIRSDQVSGKFYQRPND